MAPIDRQERRQQRLRGAGTSSVQSNFGFNIAALAKKPTKQASLTPQLSSRRTPIQKITRPADGSARRRRSASVQRSGSAKQRSTPRHPTVTPKTGKRKRGSQHAQVSEDEDELDELSPDHDKEQDRGREGVLSVEKSRRTAATVSPIHEEPNDGVDELALLNNVAVTLPKLSTGASIQARTTPPSVPARPRVSSGIVREKTPIAGRISSMTVTARTELVRRSKSREPPPSTPRILTNVRPKASSASRFGPEFHTPAATQQDDGSEDELSLPSQTPQLNSTKPQQQIIEKTADKPRPTSAPRKHEKTRRTVQSAKRKVQSTPAAVASRRNGPSTKVQEEGDLEDTLDELSPEAFRAKPHSEKSKKQTMNFVNVSSDEESESYEPEREELADATPRPVSKPKHAKHADQKPPRKRLKYTGPKHAISVMRIKGSTVRGVTAADTTRTILEQSIDQRINRMAQKMQDAEDASRRKQIRGEINLTLAFRETLNEKLLGLQDDNDTLSSGFQKRKVLKSTNSELRKEILAIQNSRQEIALELDDEQAAFNAEREKAEMRTKLSSNLFEIQAAIRNGREHARKEGRQDEGPDIPLIMLLDTVAKDVGSVGGGLLASISSFNSALERAAGWLEGRA